jgi:hypothetical protein
MPDVLPIRFVPAIEMGMSPSRSKTVVTPAGLVDEPGNERYWQVGPLGVPRQDNAGLRSRKPPRG